MQALSEDLLDGAADAAEFVFGDRGKRRAIYRLTGSGELPVIKKGRRLFYRKSDLQAAFRAAA
jgi:DNA-binding transcriptional regulator PaaX